MKNKIIFLLLFSFTLTQLFADLPFRNQRRDMFRVLGVKTENIVFLGNSITQGNEWAEAFGNDPRIINRGISGNRSSEILNNMDYILGGKPAKIFLMIGINDGAKSDIVVPNIRKTIELAQKESPETELYIQSILPHNNNANVQKTNEQLKQLCLEKSVTYIDVYSKLVVSPTHSALSSSDSNDGLHLMGTGYRKWVEGFETFTGLNPVYASGNNVSISSAHIKYVNQRLSGFALLPATNQDILMLGDFHVNTGEWRELLRNPNVKNRGIGVSLNATNISLPELKAMLPYIIRNNPAKVFIACGRKDLEYNGRTVEQAITTYSEILDEIHRLSPQTKIYIQSLIPSTSSITNNNKLLPFNMKLSELVNDENNIYFVDVYTALMDNDVLANQYKWNNGGLNGRGYLKWTEILAPFVDTDISPLNLASYDLCINLAHTRKELYSIKEGAGAGSYSQETVNHLRSLIEEAAILAYKSDVSDTELQHQSSLLTQEITALHNSDITLPKASTETEKYWYKFSAPLRNANIFMSANTTGTGVSFNIENNFKSQQWKLTLRNDNSYNIINRTDNSFLDPATPFNAQVKTSAVEPKTGWIIKKADGLSKFIISSGTVQLNLTHQKTLFNWSSGNSGNDTSDEGCQFLLTEVTSEPDEEPTVTLPEQLLILNDIECTGTKPILIPSPDAGLVLAEKTLTVAIDFTPSKTNGDAILVASTDVNNTNKFFGIGTVSNFARYGVRYVGDNNLEGWYTQTYTQNNARHQLVVTMSFEKMSYEYYLDGVYGRNVSGMGAYGYSYFGKIPNPSLYLGGVVSSNNDNRYPFTGTIHSIQFFPGELTAEQIKLINYLFTGIDEIRTNENIPFTIQGNSIIMKDNTKAKIFDLNGKLINNQALEPGFYFIQATDGKSYKAIVR